MHSVEQSANEPAELSTTSLDADNHLSDATKHDDQQAAAAAAVMIPGAPVIELQREQKSSARLAANRKLRARRFSGRRDCAMRLSRRVSRFTSLKSHRQSCRYEYYYTFYFFCCRCVYLPPSS